MAAEVIAREDHPGGRAFEVVAGNLLEEPVDAIVNAANGHLAHGGGVAAAIARAAGRALVEEGDALVRERGEVPVGEAVITTAGDLPFEGVIHAVGPHQGQGQEEERLEKALRSAFLRAHEQGWASVSFPAVSSGIFAVPLDVCSRAYVAAVRGFWAEQPETSVKSLRLCLFKGPLLDLMKDALAK
ncbi:MAG: macro domain-containing protein [Acidobacteriota bacterium]|jgi:putative ATPase